jgi:hypothetical protein
MIRYEFYDYSINDSNIHPRDVFDNERELAFKFIEDNKIQGKSHNYLFKRYNIPYCFDEDKNLVAKVDISPEEYKNYFYNSPLSKLRASEKYQKNVKELRSHIWKMYIEWIEGRCFRYLEQRENLSVLDIGSRNVGWVEEIQASSLLQNLSLLNTLPPINTESKKTEAKHDVVIALNVIQRELNPKKLLETIKNNLKDDGIAVLSFRSGTGFDILALKENNKSIFPLDHLFLPSVEGMSKLLESVGLEVVEITTPGQLDAEIVKNAVRQGECHDLLVTHLAETVSTDELQTFIQKNNLSSHVRVVVRKK